MTCLNDVLVSLTLNELFVGCGDLLTWFSYGHFTACLEVDSPCMFGECL